MRMVWRSGEIMKKSKLIEIAKQEGFEHVGGNSRTPHGADIKTWDMLALNRDELPTKTLDNLSKILENDPAFSSLSFNAMNNKITWNNEEIEDYHAMIIRRDIENRYSFVRNSKDIGDAVMMVARNNITDPIKGYLDALNWDGVPRLNDLLSNVFMAETNSNTEELIAQISAKFLISCVARIYRPGCKVDTCLVLVGGKGLGKSTSMRDLAGDSYFSDSHIDIGGKNGYELLHSTGAWIWEIAEMHSLNGKDSNTAKQFLTSPADTYRPSYGRFPITRQRRTVFCATTNDFQFLSDGPERRFWPVNIQAPIDIDYIKTNRNQIWAEAVDRYKKGELWWLDYDLEEKLAQYQSSYIIDDPWAGKILTRLNNALPHEAVTTAILMDCIDLPSSQRHIGNSRRIAQICRDLGYGQIRKQSRRAWQKLKN